MSERFRVTYRVFAASQGEAEARAEGVALEQTVEIPRDVVPAGFVEDVILGRVEEVAAEGEGTFRAVVSYAPESCGTELPQLLNVIFGNSSIQTGLKVTGLDLGPLGSVFPGARFGIAGLRRLGARARGPFVAPVLKPMGLSAAELAAIAGACARGGAHIVKEDHGLAGQPSAPFAERVARIGAAVAEANEATGRRCLYFANLAGPAEALPEMAEQAARAGAHGLLIMPGLFGFDLVRRMAGPAGPGLPVMTHPSFLGPHVLSRDTGFTHGMMFGTLQRLAGADISVFPNVGGRFGFSAGECREIVAACQGPGPGLPILPAPGGGMSPERAGEMLAMYGPDTMFLLGGSLLRAGAGIGAAVARLCEEIERVGG